MCNKIQQTLRQHIVRTAKGERKVLQRENDVEIKVKCAVFSYCIRFQRNLLACLHWSVCAICVCIYTGTGTDSAVNVDFGNIEKVVSVSAPSLSLFYIHSFSHLQYSNNANDSH